jgi:hypothetical protein
MQKFKDRKMLLFAINRALIVLAIAAILGGLLLGQWYEVWIKAVLL